VQEHTRRNEPTHWDLMLQASEALQTYRLDAPPERAMEGPNRPCTATKIQDHPLRFLTYQGSVNKGLGSVRIVDSGTYRLIDHSADHLLFDLQGKILAGKFRLAHVENDQWKLHRRLNSAD
jgi:hypothetical protein